MLEYTGAGDSARLMMLVLHDDAQREMVQRKDFPIRRSAPYAGALRRSEEGRLDRHQHEERLEAESLPLTNVMVGVDYRIVPMCGLIVCFLRDKRTSRPRREKEQNHSLIALNQIL
jgi:hypothetical protein